VLNATAMPERTQRDVLIAKTLARINETFPEIQVLINEPPPEEWDHFLRVAQWKEFSDTSAQLLVICCALDILGFKKYCNQRDLEKIRVLVDSDGKVTPHANLSVLKNQTLIALGKYYDEKGVRDPLRIGFQGRGFTPTFNKTQADTEFGAEIAFRWLNKQGADVRAKIDFPEKSEFFAPAVKRHGNGDIIAGPALFICTLVRIGHKHVLILPSNRSQAEREGVGRTTILVSLLGLRMPYQPLMSYGARDLPEWLKILVANEHGANSVVKGSKAVRDPRKPCQLIAADRAYLIINSEGNLEVIPMSGEQIDFIWDCTRHLYRSTQVNYLAGMQGALECREGLKELFLRLKPDPDVIGKYEPRWKQAHWVDEIVIVELKKEHHRTGARLIPCLPKDLPWKREIPTGLQFTIAHKAAFWSEPERRRIANEFIERVEAMDNVPQLPVKKLLIEHEYDLFSHELFFEAAQVLRSGREEDKPPTHRDDPYPRGVSAHNNAVIEALQLGQDVSIIATSGAKLLGDRDFWTALELGSRDGARATINLLDPDFAPGIQSRRIAYKSDAFLEGEIRHSIALVMRMRQSLSLSNKQLALRLYRRVPEFKLALVNSERFIVASYDPEKRTSADTVFHVIESENSGVALFEGFRRHLDNVEADAKEVKEEVDDEKRISKQVFDPNARL